MVDGTLANVMDLLSMANAMRIRIQESAGNGRWLSSAKNKTDTERCQAVVWLDIFYMSVYCSVVWNIYSLVAVTTPKESAGM
jgi:hypothetical protein